MTPRRPSKGKRPIETYEHRDKERLNNPPVGLVTPGTDPDAGQKQVYSYDPHLDPQLVWAGKAEHTSFEVPTVSLHVHERIDPRTIVEAVRKRNGEGKRQQALFAMPEENPPLRQAIEFYKHPHGWSNRLVAGDSLLVMNSLLEKEGMAGKVQMVYIDPPYGIKYGSNFQPFVNRRDVKDGKDEDLTGEPEQVRAFRDTWELGIHSYLTYLRDRILLARELLSNSGSCFLQISDENIHLVRNILDEVFGPSNFVSLISFATTSGFDASTLARTGDYILWYARNRRTIKYRQMYVEKSTQSEGGQYRWLMLQDGTYRGLKASELRGDEMVPSDGRFYQPTSLISQGGASGNQEFEYRGRRYSPGAGQHWKTTLEGMERLAWAGRIHVAQNSIRYVRMVDDFPVKPITNLWTDTATGNFTGEKIFVVQTADKVVQRCILMTTDPGDLVLDPTCGSGTTAHVAEQWGRRWITCDTSRVALTLAKQRLMTAVFDYYELARPEEGVGSGFRYRTVPHITLRSIANNPDIKEGMSREQIDSAIARHAPQETLYDQPLVDRKKKRVSGPFTSEAVPAPAVKSVDEILAATPQAADASIARSGETLRQSEWRDELLRTGIRGRAGQYIRFARLEPLPGSRWLHADGETRATAEGDGSPGEANPSQVPQRIVISFGPEYAPLEQRQVAQAIDEAQTLVPRPKLIVFAAFQFDPEAAKDIDETKWPGVTLLKAQMNADLLTDDLKKKRASNESFWLIGQPDVQLEPIREGKHQGNYRVSVHGFDYYNTRTGNIESGSADRIAVWILDTDYDGRSLYPRQVFFPMAGEKDGWTRLARNLKAEIDADLMEAYHGTISLPFAPGEYRRIAVKIVDDRGIESLKVLGVD